LELAQQVINVIQSYNEEKGLFEEEFETMKNGSENLETTIRTECQMINSEVSGVGTQMELHQAVLQEVWVGIQILKAQDDRIVEEASELFQEPRMEMAIMSKRRTDNSVRILAIQGTNKRIQDGMNHLTKNIDQVNIILTSITKSLKEVPSKQELSEHAVAMDEQVVQIQEVNTGLTTTMEK